MRKFFLIVLALMLALPVMGSTRFLKGAKMTGASTTILTDTVTIENNLYGTPYLCVGYASYGNTMSNDSATIITVTITPFLAALTDSLGGTAAVTLATVRFSSLTTVDSAE